MSRLDELIAALCPEGVAFVRLSDVCVFRRGTTLVSSEAVGGEVPVISGGRTPAFYHNEANRPAGCVTVASSGTAGYVSYWDVPILCADSFTELISLLERELDLRRKQYAYYCGKLLTFGEDMKHITLGQVGRVYMCKRILKKDTSQTGGVPFYKIGTFGGKPDSIHCAMSHLQRLRLGRNNTPTIAISC